MSRLDISMGVTYKLRDEVVHYIISERQANPLLSCRQLAESASQRFGLNLSKSSVHDVLKESGIMTPRGRKPKDKFTIPHEKKKQIQDSLSQIKLTPVMPPEPVQEPALEPIVPAAPIQEIPAEPVIPAEPAPELPVEPASSEPSAPIEPKLGLIPDIAQEQPVSLLPSLPAPQPQPDPVLLPEEPIVLEARPPEEEISTEYEGAGAIFQKAAMWDLGIFSEEDIKETDWPYYLTYVKGVKLFLEDGQELFIPMPLPI